MTPPTANGKFHIGHVLTSNQRYHPRYRTMKGYNVYARQDGIPMAQNGSEKLLGIDGKEQIEAYSLEPFREM